MLEREYARWRDPGREARFYRRVPWSYLYGGLLRTWAPAEVETGRSSAILRDGEPGVAYLRLRRPRG